MTLHTKEVFQTKLNSFIGDDYISATSTTRRILNEILGLDIAYNLSIDVNGNYACVIYRNYLLFDLTYTRSRVKNGRFYYFKIKTIELRMNPRCHQFLDGLALEEMFREVNNIIDGKLAKMKEVIEVLLPMFDNNPSKVFESLNEIKKYRWELEKYIENN